MDGMIGNIPFVLGSIIMALIVKLLMPAMIFR